MEKILRNYLLIFLLLFNFCTKPFSQKLILGDIYNPNFTSYKQKDIDEIFRILTDFFNAIEKKDLMLIQDSILEEKGIYINPKKTFLKKFNKKIVISIIYI